MARVPEGLPNEGQRIKDEAGEARSFAPLDNGTMAPSDFDRRPLTEEIK